jgi:hypothetical protein
MASSLGRAVCTRSGCDRRLLGLHAIGLWIGATAAGLLVALLGRLIPGTGTQMALDAVVMVVGLLTFGQLFALRPIQSRWQVPRHWMGLLGPETTAGLYGLLLGAGVLTAVVVTAFWAFVVASLVVSPVVAIVGWSCYAAARATGFYVSSRWVGADFLWRQRGLQMTSGALSCAFGVSAVLHH